MQAIHAPEINILTQNSPVCDPLPGFLRQFPYFSSAFDHNSRRHAQIPVYRSPGNILPVHCYVFKCRTGPQQIGS